MLIEKVREVIVAVITIVTSIAALGLLVNKLTPVRAFVVHILASSIEKAVSPFIKKTTANTKSIELLSAELALMRTVLEQNLESDKSKHDALIRDLDAVSALANKSIALSREANQTITEAIGDFRLEIEQKLGGRKR